MSSFDNWCSDACKENIMSEKFNKNREKSNVDTKGLVKRKSLLQKTTLKSKTSLKSYKKLAKESKVTKRTIYDYLQIIEHYQAKIDQLNALGRIA